MNLKDEMTPEKKEALLDPTTAESVDVSARVKDCPTCFKFCFTNTNDLSH